MTPKTILAIYKTPRKQKPGLQQSTCFQQQDNNQTAIQHQDNNEPALQHQDNNQPALQHQDNNGQTLCVIFAPQHSSLLALSYTKGQ